MTKARTLADNFAADINGITAGTGISGGGTSGTVTVTNSMATAIDAKGDLVVGTGADTFSRLAVASTAGYLLSVDSGEATGLKWAAPAGGGKVLQVVSTTFSTATTITSGSYTDSGLSLSITPTKSDSKILVLVSQPTVAFKTGTNLGASGRIMRGATEIIACPRVVVLVTTNTLNYVLSVVNFNYLDSPATTSSTTYKTQFASVDSASVTAQVDSSTATMTLLEIGV